MKLTEFFSLRQWEIEMSSNWDEKLRSVPIAKLQGKHTEEKLRG